tara:strand:+ start:8695 stop:9462 length:768 start_codon:yes stop_codon:yes gene_type:complete
VKITQSQDERRFDASGITLSAHQPEFLPWLGYVSKASMADVYFILDTVQYVKDVFQNRNKIRIKQGDGWQWLNIPVKKAGSRLMDWKDVEMDTNQNWKKKHLNSIYYSYHKAPHFQALYEKIESIYMSDDIFLLEFVIKMSKLILSEFEINIPIYRTSELIQQGFDIKGSKSDLIINMCRAVNANNFIFGSLGRTYIDKNKFKDNDINYYFQNFSHPMYDQFHGDFISHMSSIDLLFNYGPKSVKMLGKSKGDIE